MNSPITRLQQTLQQGEGYLIQSPANRRYLTGFASSAGVVVVTKEHCVFFTDFRYIEQAKKQVTACDVRELTSLSGDVLPLLLDVAVTTLFVETDYVSVGEFHRLARIFEKVELSNDNRLTETLDRMRSIKMPEEIKKIKQAQALTDAGFDYIVSRIQAGRTEREIQLELEFFLRNQGSEGVAFDLIAVSGENSSLPHGVATHKAIEKGDFLTLDFGAVVDGYRSDMTRTVAVGEPSREQRQVYETVRLAKQTAMAGIRPDAVCKDIDKIARDLIDKAGYQGCFGHGLGHSVGLDIHENPSFNTRCETKLAAGMVLTVEPGIYLAGRFGVRIEDMVVVTKQGYENLTHSTDQLMVL